MRSHTGFKRWIVEPYRHRTLFWSFITQEIKGRYVGSILGLVWSLLLPIANMLIYIFVFTMIFKIQLRPGYGTQNFVLYLLSGLLPWMMFAEAIGISPGIFISRANLITKVAFPVELLPLSGVVVVFFINSIGLLLFLCFLGMKGHASFYWLLLPAVVGVHMLFTLGLVVLIASLSVFIRDIHQMIGVVLSLWMYLTPILYPISMVPQQLQWMLYLNPLCLYIELYHQVLLCNTISWEMLLGCSALALVFFMAGAGFFSKSRNAFADVL